MRNALLTDGQFAAACVLFFQLSLIWHLTGAIVRTLVNRYEDWLYLRRNRPEERVESSDE